MFKVTSRGVGGWGRNVSLFNDFFFPFQNDLKIPRTLFSFFFPRLFLISREIRLPFCNFYWAWVIFLWLCCCIFHYIQIGLKCWRGIVASKSLNLKGMKKQRSTSDGLINITSYPSEVFFFCLFFYFLFFNFSDTWGCQSALLWCIALGI